jgi:hypothetical protein
MESESEELEREAEKTRWLLSETLEELRGRLTLGRVIDQLIDNAREGPAAEVFHNLGREVRENPMPLVLIGIGIAWLMVASNRSSRAMIATARDSVARKTVDIGAATSAAMRMTSDWGHQTTARAADRASELAITVRSESSELAKRPREAADGLVEKTGTACAVVVAASEKAKWPLTGAPRGAHRSDRANDDDLVLAISCDTEVGKEKGMEDDRAAAYEHW